MDPKLAALIQEYPETTYEKEVRDWLRDNRDLFLRGDRNLLEIAEMAIHYAKLDPVAVRAVLGHTGALRGQRFERMNAQREMLQDFALQELSGAFDLTLSWEALYDYQTKGKDFK